MVEPYYQILDDLVVEQDGASGTAGNVGEGTSYGLDVVLTRQFANRWSANATYSYNNARRDNNDGMGEFDADFNREHVFTLGGQWEISDRWLVGARWKYVSGRPRDAFIIHEDVLGPGQPLRYSKEITRQNVHRADDFSLLNVRVDYRRPIGPVDLIAFLDVVNLYGASNSDSVEFDPRRGINVEESGEVTPLIGLRFERTW
jgi:outer membrane receptor protein involved in Fe transport